MLLIPRGEFSLVIAGVGVAAQVEPDLGPVAIAYVLMMVVVGPILVRVFQPKDAPEEIVTSER